MQYVLYLGANDKDTNEPVFDKDEAKEHLKAVLIQSDSTGTEFYSGE